VILLTLTPEKTLPVLRELAGQVIPIAPCAPGTILREKGGANSPHEH